VLDGRSFSGRVSGTIPTTDLALVRIDEDATLPAAKLGNSKKLKPGEIAIAIGNPLGFDASVTAGSYPRSGAPCGQKSALIEDVIRPTRRSIRAIRAARLSHRKVRSSASTPRYFRRARHLLAVASNTASFVLGELVAHEGSAAPISASAPAQCRCRAGSRCDSPHAEDGAVISAVEAGSPADHAGLLTGDILLALDGTPITGR